ncbi:hypothetical protein [Bailinhaonella thermotolerans]|uniref:Uncharacterized protein n=1 Tax=Bailinhaonella thermotolerans TaxID=1070861 RepID=A0A3A4A5V2_9ACTN|nr:hypothetical protein [Bailinhaonella thermotolerans]RJL23241.1 hypothetical protein D5H75_33260 [Bailinhaonella thermotolerans]
MSVTQYAGLVDTDPRHFLPKNKFYAKATRGELTEEHLRRLVAAKFQALEAEVAGHGMLVVRHRDPAPAKLFAFTVYWLARSGERLLEAARALGLTEEELAQTAPDPSIQPWYDFLASVGLHAGPAEAALMIRTDFLTWSALCGALSDALRESKIPDEVRDYLDAERDVPGEILDEALRVVEYGVSHGEDKERIARSARRVLSAQEAAWEHASET